jgi:hypothetical protein
MRGMRSARLKQPARAESTARPRARRAAPRAALREMAGEMQSVALSAVRVLRIVLRPVNEPDSAGVPPNEPAAAPQTGGDAAGVPHEGAAAPRREPDAERGADAAGGDDAGGADDGGAPGDGGGPDATGAPGEGGERRRRRRRRRRRGAGGGPDGAAAGGDAGGQGGAADGAAATPDGTNSVNAAHDGGAGAPAAGPRPDAPRGGQRQGGRPQHPPHAGRGQHQGHGKHGHAHDRHGHGRPGFGPGRTRGDSQHAAMAAVQALADMAHTLLRVEGVDPLAMPRYLELNLRVPLDGGNDVRHAAGTAVEQISKRVREVREHEKALRPGAVYSYFAGSSHADGCRPTEPRHVFDGYSSTGKPQFSDFVTLAIERKDQQIERLLAGEEIILTHVTMGRVLRTQQLAEFGSHSPVFKILGQVDAGLFRVLGAAGRCAFSFQLLRGTTLEGRVRLRLHPVGAVDPMDLADPAIVQILSRFQRHLDLEAMRLQGQQAQANGEVDEEQFVLPLLQDLARQLQNRTRNAGRRTQHGLERAEEGQRPTSRAYPDAGEAHDDAILWDLDQNTIVVLGGKGRVHVFTPQGKHVTSVMMQGGAIDRRRQQGRWRLAEPEERGEFRIHIKRLIASGENTTQDDAVQVPRPVAPPAASAPPVPAPVPLPVAPAPTLPPPPESLSPASPAPQPAPSDEPPAP